MGLWKMTRAKSAAAVKLAVLAFAVFASSLVMTAPVFAGGSTDNIIVYDNREKTLKIREISFNGDYTSMSVLVENLVTNAEFRIEHGVDTGDTFNEYMEVTATDGMGAVSETVHIKNPFYAPEVTETIEEAETVPIAGSLSVMGGSGEDGETENTDNEAEEAAAPIAADNESSGENDSFSTSGWASVVDNAESGDKEFFIVRSETGNEFYVMIDREGGNENVYFLNAVTEWDLLGLTQEFEVPNNLDPNGELNAAVNAGTQAPQGNGEAQTAPPTEESTANEPQEEQPESGGIGVFGTILLVIFAGAVGAYFYFFKFRRKNAGEVKDGYLPDDYGDEGEDEEENTDGTEDYEDDEEYEEDTEADETGVIPNVTEPAPEPEKSRAPVSDAEPPEASGGKRGAPDNPDKDVGYSDDEGFTDEDVSDGYYEESDDYGEEVDEDDVLGGAEGGDEDEDKTV